MRDRMAIAISNWVLRTFATKHTAKMRAAARDQRTGTPAPSDWRRWPNTTGTIYKPDAHTFTINGWSL